MIGYRARERERKRKILQERERLRTIMILLRQTKIVTPPKTKFDLRA